MTREEVELLGLSFSSYQQSAEPNKGRNGLLWRLKETKEIVIFLKKKILQKIQGPNVYFILRLVAAPHVH